MLVRAALGRAFRVPPLWEIYLDLVLFTGSGVLALLCLRGVIPPAAQPKLFLLSVQCVLFLFIQDSLFSHLRVEDW